MTIAIKYTDDRKGAILVGSGRLKGAEFIAANNELFARDFAAEPLLYILFDGDGATSVDVTVQDIQEIAQQDVEASGKLPHISVAVFAQDELAYGLARMWQVYVDASGWQTAVFRDRASAVTWLRKDVAERTGIDITLE
jgi:hypothetical protein